MKFVCVTQIFFIFMDSQSECLKVVGAAAPLFAVAGEDLVLPCSIQPSTSAVDMRVEWFRVDVTDSLVHLYKDREDKNEGQILSYRGRTALSREELQKGNASLKLSAVQVSDEGAYKCLVEAKSWYDDITVNVIVEVLGTHPVITMEGYDNLGGINLVCESKGWNPKPDVWWLDREGVTLNAEDTETHRDTEGFRVKHSITVHDSDSNRFYCRLQQKHHMRETDIIISGKVFHAWKFAVVSISVLAVISAVVFIVTIICVCQKKEKIERASFHVFFCTFHAHFCGVSLCCPYFYCFFSEILSKKLQNDFEKEKQYAEIQRQRVEDEFEKKMNHAVEVTLEADTASPKLILSDDGKQVTHGDTKQDLPDTPERFDHCPCVLGKEGFSSGRIYYEVQVSGKTKWDLGVAKESINRKGKITLDPQNGFWAIVLRKGNEYRACVGSSILLYPREKLQKVGVFMDYEEGLVSFYDVESRSHIYSFTGQSFTEKLYPYFSPCNNKRGKNSAPLVISPVSE
ncbi:butyrophilin subfamily 2 member A2-like [Colossoma macropomum]|uniref:butyrophilin subfamily 2 member A2-like n=1 Tax=Colossoma macropomum TaxID=42526 RepID=UPI0018645560|nr:butyrophilin subfamily 2 member A2-like [Colossoma macropomum]